MDIRTKIGGNIYECSVIRAGLPNIVFLNGFRMNMGTWSAVVPELKDAGTTFIYNRLSVGKSNKARVPQTGHIIVEELRDLLQQNEIYPPYVLVGHSLGGLYTNLYARRFPAEVSAMALVDAAHPDEHEAQLKFKAPFVVHWINEGVKTIQRIFDPFLYSEHQCVLETVEQIRSAGEFPDIPLAVISGSKKMPFVPEASFDIHLRFQNRNLDLSSQSEQYLASESGHFPQITKPEVVVSAIRDVITRSMAG